MAYTPNLTHLWIPPGKPGTQQTLDQMRNLAIQAAHHPAIQQLATQLNDPLGVDWFLRENWTFRADPDWCEYIEGPEFQLAQFTERHRFLGDCDDAATLACALMTSIGWPNSLIAYRVGNDENFSHVNLRCYNTSALDFFDIDPIVPPERLPIRATEILEVQVL